MTATRVLGSLLLASTLVLGGCRALGQAGPGDAAFDECVAAVDDLGADRAQFCRRVIDLAEERVGWLRQVEFVRFRQEICPPNARCMPPPPGAGWVIFLFGDGDPSMVHVGPPEALGAPGDGLVASAPEPVPDWLLDELAAAAPN